MNPIAAHKDELKKLLENLSGDTAVSGITFVASPDAYITPSIRIAQTSVPRQSNPPPAQTNGELNGTNIDSELGALLRAT